MGFFSPRTAAAASITGACLLLAFACRVDPTAGSARSGKSEAAASTETPVVVAPPPQPEPPAESDVEIVGFIPSSESTQITGANLTATNASFTSASFVVVEVMASNFVFVPRAVTLTPENREFVYREAKVPAAFRQTTVVRFRFVDIVKGVPVERCADAYVAAKTVVLDDATTVACRLLSRIASTPEGQKIVPVAQLSELRTAGAAFVATGATVDDKTINSVADGYTAVRVAQTLAVPVTTAQLGDGLALASATTPPEDIRQRLATNTFSHLRNAAAENVVATQTTSAAIDPRTFASTDQLTYRLSVDPALQMQQMLTSYVYGYLSVGISASTGQYLPPAEIQAKLPGDKIGTVVTLVSYAYSGSMAQVTQVTTLATAIKDTATGGTTTVIIDPMGLPPPPVVPPPLPEPVNPVVTNTPPPPPPQNPGPQMGDGMTHTQAGPVAGDWKLFVTQVLTNGAGVNDSLCQTEAAIAGLGGTQWFAVRSLTSMTAFTRFANSWGVHQRPVFNTANEMLGASLPILANNGLGVGTAHYFGNGMFAAEVAKDRMMVAIELHGASGVGRIWTGATPNGGLGAFNCNNWTSSDPFMSGAIGSATGPTWLSAGEDAACDQQLRVLCAGY